MPITLVDSRTISAPPRDSDWVFLLPQNQGVFHTIKPVGSFPFTWGLLGYAQWVITPFNEPVFQTDASVPLLADTHVLVTPRWRVLFTPGQSLVPGYLAVHVNSWIPACTLELYEITDLSYAT